MTGVILPLQHRDMGSTMELEGAALELYMLFEQMMKVARPLL